MHSSRRQLTVITFAALALGVGISGCGSSSDSTASSSGGATQSAADTSAAAGGNTVDATLKEWSITTKSPTVNAGKVTFIATNAGSAPHQLTVLKTDKPEGSLATNGEVSVKDSVGEVATVDPGSSGKTVPALDLKPGKYVLICNLPGHYAQGMHTSLTVK
jgi:uncharacterized cupredoxin-like copper-binding protein